MPTIQIKSAEKLSDSVKESIKSELGKAIELIPGKSENWLMVLFGHCEDIYFKGIKDSQAALVEIGIKGNASADDFSALGKAVTDSIVRHTDLKSDHIYISFTEFTNYMWNSSML